MACQPLNLVAGNGWSMDQVSQVFDGADPDCDAFIDLLVILIDKIGRLRAFQKRICLSTLSP